MEAFQICSELYKWIEEGDRYGKIHSIFNNSINIISGDGRLIPLFIYSKPMAPNSIRLTKTSSFDDLGILVGEKGIFTEHAFISERIYLSYGQAMLWDKSIKLDLKLDTYKNLELKVDQIMEFILNHGNRDGVFALLQFMPGAIVAEGDASELDRSHIFIRERLQAFIEDFRDYKIDHINSSAMKIIGFGPGLTPAMDDFLSGMMMANIYINYFLGLDIEKAYALNGQIVKDIEAKTSLVSEEMLKSSARGEGNQDLKNLMMGLIGPSTEEAFNDLLMKVIDFGHSSGTDILCGIYIATYILHRG